LVGVRSHHWAVGRHVAVLKTIVVRVRIVLVRACSVNRLLAHHALVHGLILVVWLGLVVHLDWVSVRVSLHWFLFAAHECHNNTY
jgi:hypothetical protein